MTTVPEALQGNPREFAMPQGTRYSDSPEGVQRRKRLLDKIEDLRRKLGAVGFKLVGEASRLQVIV